VKGFLNFGVPDRRGNVRVRMQCPVVLWDPDEGSVLRTNTDNISCEGFYCRCSTRYRVGARLEALLEVPCDGLPGHADRRNLVLHCQVQVIRVDLKRRGVAFGVGVEIESFAVPATSLRDGFALRAPVEEMALSYHG